MQATDYVRLGDRPQQGDQVPHKEQEEIDDDKFFDFKNDSIILSLLKVAGFIVLSPLVIVFFGAKGAFMAVVWLFDGGLLTILVGFYKWVLSPPIYYVIIPLIREITNFMINGTIRFGTALLSLGKVIWTSVEILGNLTLSALAAIFRMVGKLLIAAWPYISFIPKQIGIILTELFKSFMRGIQLFLVQLSNLAISLGYILKAIGQVLTYFIAVLGKCLVYVGGYIWIGMEAVGRVLHFIAMWIGKGLSRVGELLWTMISFISFQIYVVLRELYRNFIQGLNLFMIQLKNLFIALGLIFKVIGQVLFQIISVVGEGLKYILTKVGKAICYILIKIGTGIYCVAAVIGYVLYIILSALYVACAWAGHHLWRGVRAVSLEIYSALCYLGRGLAWIGGHAWNGIKAVGRGLAYLGGLIWSGVKAVGRGLAVVGRAIWRGLSAVGRVIWAGITAIGRGLAVVGRAIWRGIVSVGRVIGAGLATIGRGIAAVGRAIGRGIRSVGRGLMQAIRAIGRGFRAIGRSIARFFR